MFGTTRVRFFTPLEANQTLRQVLPDIERAVERAHQHASFTNTLNSGDVPAHERETIQDEMEQLQDEIQSIIERFRSLGLEVKGLHEGLIDFPALRAGQEVYLCWKSGETFVSHWHPLHTGFDGRFPLDPNEELGLWEWCN